MKVVHISYTHRYDDIRIYEKECKSLKRKGYDVLHIASDKISDISNDLDLDVPVKIIKLKKLKRFKVVWQYLKDVREEVDKINPQICHLHDWQLLPLIISLRKKCVVIFDSHEDFPAYLSTNMMKKIPQNIKQTVFSFIEKFFLKRASFVVAANSHIAKEIKKMTKKVIAVKNYPIVFENHEKNYYNPQFCYIGRMSDYLGGEVLSKGLNDLHTKLLLVGRNDEEYVKKMNDLSGDRIEDIGFCSKAKVRKIVKESMAGIVTYFPTPNCIHALPNKMFEYLEASVPIICSNFPDWKEMLEKRNCCIFVNPYDDNELKDAMRYFLEHPDEAKRMGENGRKAIEEEFNWNREEEKLFSLYQRLESM